MTDTTRHAVKELFVVAMVGLAAALVTLAPSAPAQTVPPAAATTSPPTTAEEVDLAAKFIDTGDSAAATRPDADVAGDPELFGLLDRKTEAAIQRGLAYLKQIQGTDGRWNGDDANWTAYNAFAMIGFMLNGHFPNKKQPYGETMTKSLDALLKESESQGGGYMGTNMYAHGLATVALSEAWGQTDKDEQVQAALKGAVKIILRSQNEAGGWRYNPQPGGADVSVTAMQVVALAAARQAGIFVPDDTITRAVRYVNMCHHEASGGATYQAGFGVPGFARTGAATLSLMMLGKHEAREVKEGVRYLQREGAAGAMRQTDHYMYGHYYAAMVMYQAGDQEFKKWYPQIRDILLKRQQKSGNFGGRGAYDTAISLIILSIPYGYVPAYQR